MRVSISLVLLAACCHSGPARPGASRPGYVNTGDPIPETAESNPGCPDRAPGATRWVDSNPHTPLAVVDAHGIHGEVACCCAAWARRGTRWHTIDRYGAIAGEAELVGGEGYDVSQCYELAFEQRSGSAGVGLYASVGGAWQGAPSVEWKPTADQRASLAAFVTASEALLDDPPSWASGEPAALPIEERTIYFQVSRQPWEGSTAGVDRYAVVGGRALLVARLNDKGRWTQSHLDPRFANVGVNRAYQPLAVFDLDGDGAPEIVFHWNAGDGWSDTILGLDANGRLWEERAESVGGSTA